MTHSDDNPSPLQAGGSLKHYEIIRKLGEGGMGTVFLARDTKLGRLVAPFGFVRSGRQYCLLYPAELANLPKVRTFRGWIDKARRR